MNYIKMLQGILFRIWNIHSVFGKFIPYLEYPFRIWNDLFRIWNDKLVNV